jgi:hypothetical protein
MIFALTVKNFISFLIFIIRICIEGGGSAAGYDQNYQYGAENSQQNEFVEVTVQPTEVNIARGEKATIACHVKGAQQYKVTWGKYAHDTSLPDYAHVCIHKRNHSIK